MTKVDKDPRIIAAAAHWSHRMVTNGIPLADFKDVTNNINPVSYTHLTLPPTPYE